MRSRLEGTCRGGLASCAALAWPVTTRPPTATSTSRRGSGRP